ATVSLSNTATVTPPAGFTDGKASNNSATDTDTLTPQADLSISKSGPATTVAGAAAGFDYTLTVTNNGLSDNVGGFMVTDVLPAGTTFQSTGSTAGASVIGQMVTYTNSSGLVAGDLQTFT